MDTKVRAYRTQTYRSWESMRLRCSATHPSRHRYLDRGITIDPRWDEYATFYEDMGERPSGLSLERLDNDKGYSKDNCAWATTKAQANNRRTNRHITWRGRTLTLSQWADALDLKYKLLHNRLNKKGWAVERAFTTPIRKKAS